MSQVEDPRQDAPRAEVLAKSHEAARGASKAFRRCLPPITAFFSVAMGLAAEERSPDPSAGDAYDLSTIVVTATRSEAEELKVPFTVHTMDAVDLRERRQVRTVPEAFFEVPGVMVQKTAHGQGSPFVRGFTGFRTLMLVDGIRLNNSTFRDGPNQYWNTIDALSVGRMELVMGPSSVLYGSDAVGGTAQALTRDYSSFGADSGLQSKLYYRYADAEESSIGRAEFGYGAGAGDGQFSVYGGVSVKDFGELEGGSDRGRQDRTDYDETDLDLKAQYELPSGHKWIFAYQDVDQEDAWRTHRTIFGESWEGTTVGNELRRSHDQDRHLAYLQYRGENVTDWLDGFDVSLSYHQQHEQRLRIRSDGRIDTQGVDTDTTGFWAQARTDTGFGIWTYGFEIYHDDVSSFRHDFNADGSLNAIRVQGPVADDSEYDLVGAYLQNEIDASERLSFILGARYTYADLDAGKVAEPIHGGQYSFTEDWREVTGSLRASYALGDTDSWFLFGGVSQGFRAPNLSDLTRLDSARSNEIETPVAGLDPEEFVTYEIGLKASLANWSGQLSYYYTDIEDLIIRTPTGVIIDGDEEVTKKNAGDGAVRGVEFQGQVSLPADFQLIGGLAWLDGDVRTFPTSEPAQRYEPLNRMMPFTANLGLRWQRPGERFWGEAMVIYADEQDDLSTRDESDTQRIPPGGTPDYTVLTLRGGWRVLENLSLALALENVTDEDYRVHGSGLNGPGRNFLATLNWQL